MPGFGMGLGGLGQAGNAYANFQNQQNVADLNKQKLQQALMEMAQAQQARQAQQQALQQFSTMQGSGPNGAVTPQQIAGASQGNPEAAQLLTGLSKPTQAPLINLQGREYAADQGLAGRGVTAQGARDVANIRETGENTRAANKAAKPADITKSPEYKNAAEDMKQANQTMIAIERNYAASGNVTGYLKDPQWIQANQSYAAARKARDSVKVAPVAAPAAAAPTAPDISQLKAGEDKSFDNGQTWWTVTDGKATQVQ